MTAGAFGQLIASPTDLVKVQMQMEGKRVLVEGRRPRYDYNMIIVIHSFSLTGCSLATDSQCFCFGAESTICVHGCRD